MALLVLLCIPSPDETCAIGKHTYKNNNTVAKIGRFPLLSGLKIKGISLGANHIFINLVAAAASDFSSELQRKAGLD